MECDSEMNELTIEVENNKNYKIHSCWKLRLWLMGQGTEKDVQVVILAVESVEINHIFAKGVEIYSDAKITTVKKLEAPIETFRLSAPGTKVVIEGAKLNNNSQSVTITDAEHTLFKNTVLGGAELKTDFASLVEFSQSTGNNITWAADQVQNIRVTNWSDINVKLPDDKMTCEYQDGFPVRSFCPDTKVEISNSSSFNKRSNINNAYISDSGLFSDTTVHINEQDKGKCSRECFGKESIQYDLKRCVKLNNIIGAEDLKDKNGTQISGLLTIAVSNNAYHMAEYIIRIKPGVINERGPFGRTELFYAGLAFTQFTSFQMHS